MIFFGRSAIHESAFVFFQIMWIVGFLKFREKMNQLGLIWFFAGLLGCILLKETFVILGISFFLSWGFLEISPKILRLINREVASPEHIEFVLVKKTFLLKISFIFAVVWLFFYTGYFHHWKGATDFFVALMPWLKTGTGGSGHDKPFYYWLTLLWRYEWLSIIGLIAACAGAFSRSWKLRFCSSMALINGLIYSFIPYKTPWCITSILWPFVFVAGLWLESVFVKVRHRNNLVILLSFSLVFIGIAHSAITGYRLNFKNYANPSEPYVYVQTKNDFKIIEDIIKRRIKNVPDLHNITVMISLNDPWPLPWFFCRFPNVRYGLYYEVTKPEEDIIFTESTADSKGLVGLYLRRLIDLRDARAPIYVYLKKSTFDGIDLTGFNTIQE